jgi:hypothetical protein
MLYKLARAIWLLVGAAWFAITLHPHEARALARSAVGKS